MTKGARVLALVTDAYDGYGGIAHYARDSIAAMAADPRVAEVVVLPRIAGTSSQPLPSKVREDRAAGANGVAYVARLAAELARGRFDAVWTAHINLSPFGLLAARISDARLGLVLHGVEAWKTHRRRLTRLAAPWADLILPVSRVTEDRYRLAYGSRQRALIAPGAVDLARFTPRPRSPQLAKRLGLDGRRVLMTLGRLHPAERAKGFDRVIASLPQLLKRHPDLCYLICGDGGDRARLEGLARSLGVEQRVIFAGRVAEDEKPDYFRAADVYVMPSVMEGLGIVVLEALACGIPSIASLADGSCEAVADGRGQAVDPFQPDALVEAIDRALGMPHGRPFGLDHFGSDAFRVRTAEMLDILLGEWP